MSQYIDFDVEISPSNRARCRECNEKIPKDAPRLVENYSSSYYNQASKKFFCRPCGLRKLAKLEDEVKDVFHQLQSGHIRETEEEFDEEESEPQPNCRSCNLDVEPDSMGNCPHCGSYLLLPDD